MDYYERVSHARSVYPTQDTWRMGTARVKQEQEVFICSEYMRFIIILVAYMLS